MTTKIRNRDSASYGRDVACPTCTAPVGEPCHNAAGRKTVAHSRRTSRGEV